LSDANRFGLEEDWAFVEAVLKDVIPVYDKTNRYISLGSDLKIRKFGLDLLKQSLTNFSDVLVLDLGCGTGRMTQLLQGNSIMVDALRPMMQIASERNPDSDKALAIFEKLPFKKGSFHAVMAGFAIRDARKLTDALAEIHYSLREGGFFLIVDLSKPDSKIKRALIAVYWRAIAPFIAFIFAGWLGLKFAALSTTFRKLPTNSQLLSLTQTTGFELLASKYFMLGGASCLLLRKRSQNFNLGSPR
jgi:demethylmenaquinone methyltransferase / 2-methoxy-6-polyprenyl-1,4-benzoquinol methylase